MGFSTIFPFLPFYVNDLGTKTSLSLEFLAGMVYSGQSFVMMITSPIWGAVADRYGRKLMVERALFGGAIIVFLMAFVQSAEQLVILRMIQGAVTGVVAAASALVAGVTPRERIGYAMGLLQVALTTGVALGPLIGGAVADVLGYRAAFYITSTLLFAAGIIVLVGVKEGFNPKKAAKEKRIGFLQEWRHILSVAGIKTTYLMRFLSQLGRMMIIPVAPLFIQSLMVSSQGLNTFTGLVIGVGSAATTISAVYLGKLGDRIGHRKIAILSSGVAALLYFLQGLVSAPWQLLVLQVFVGVAMGGIIPALSALLALLSEGGDEGAVYGLDNSINAAGRALAPLIGGAAAAAFGLRSAFVLTATVFLISVLVALKGLPRASEINRLEAS
jgi:DHA1 family multidrug resistance protein-like MFS transporter